MFKLHLKLNCLFKNKKEAKLSPKLTSNGKEWNDNDKLLRPVLGLKNKSARKILNFVRKKSQADLQPVCTPSRSALMTSRLELTYSKLNFCITKTSLEKSNKLFL